MFLESVSSISTCERFLVRTPRGPVTRTRLAFISTVTPSGIAMFSEVETFFIYAGGWFGWVWISVPLLIFVAGGLCGGGW